MKVRIGTNVDTNNREYAHNPHAMDEDKMLFTKYSSFRLTARPCFQKVGSHLSMQPAAYDGKLREFRVVQCQRTGTKIKD